MDPANDVMAHVTSGALVVYGLQYLKTVGWCPWLTQNTKNVNRILSAIAAAALAFGITATGDASQGWVVQIPNSHALLAGVWHFGEQLTTQQLLYDGIAQRAGAAKGATV